MDAKSAIRKAGFYTVTLFALSLFISKSAMNVMGALMFTLSLYYILRYERDIFTQNIYLLILLVPFIIGFMLNVLSPEGFKGAFNFANRFKFYLVFIPLATFVDSKKKLDMVLVSLVVSGTIGAIYSVVFTQPPYFNVLVSFLEVGRNADMLMAATLLCMVMWFRYPLTGRNQKLIFRAVLTGIIILFVVCIIMGSSMAAFLGLLVGTVLFAIFYQRTLLLIPIAGFLIISYVPQLKVFKDDVLVSFIYSGDYKPYSMEHERNQARLHLWKTGIDFVKGYPLYGTGKRKPAEYFLEFFEQQPTEYQKKYFYAVPYAGNFHNSYIQIMAEAGVLTFIIYMAAILYILALQVLRSTTVPAAERCYIIASVVTSAGFLTAQMFHGELHSYGSYTFYMVFFGGCFVLNRHVDWWHWRSPKKAESNIDET